MPILFEPVVGCVELKLLANYKTFTDTCVMTLHAKTPTSAPDAAAVEEVVSIVQTWVTDKLSLYISEDWRIYSIYGESMAVNPPPFFAVAVDTLGVLGVSYDAIYAPLILLHGPAASRSELGKSYVFGPNQDAVRITGYDGDLLANLITAYQLLNTALAGGSYGLAVPSKKLGQCFFTNSITASPRKTIQKRRRPGFGG